MLFIQPTPTSYSNPLTCILTHVFMAFISLCMHYFMCIPIFLGANLPYERIFELYKLQNIFFGFLKLILQLEMSLR